MRNLIAIFLVLSVFSCKNQSDNNSKTETKNEIETQVVNETKSQETLDEYIALLNSLSVFDINSISIAKDYVKNKMNVSESLADSAYYIFLEFFYTTANNLTDSLETKYSSVINKLYENNEDSEVKEFYSLLNRNGLELFMTEGIFYADVKSDFFYNTFKNNLSPSLKEYLQLRNKELKEAFSEDAILLLSFDKLSERVYAWEKFIESYPNTKLIGEANYYYEVYLETLLTGLDNSRLFDWDSNIMLPEVKQTYEIYKASYPETKSGKIISEYYQILKRNDFHYSDSIDFILKKYNLSSMRGIQPHLR